MSTTHDRLRVVVVAGDEILRRGLTSVIEEDPLSTSVESHDAGGLDRSLSHTRCDLVLVAVDDAESVAAALAGANPRPRVLAVVHESTQTSSLSAARAAIDGVAWACRDCIGRLREVIRRCADGEYPRPATTVRTSVADRTGRPHPRERGEAVAPPVALTPREKQVLDLLATGLGNSPISRRLGVSENGAKRLVASIMTKLGTQNRTATVMHAIRLGIVGCPASRCHSGPFCPEPSSH